MELKLHDTYGYILGKIGSNRTFMELKCGYRAEGAKDAVGVLIAPLWN